MALSGILQKLGLGGDDDDSAPAPAQAPAAAAADAQPAARSRKRGGRKNRARRKKAQPVDSDSDSSDDARPEQRAPAPAEAPENLAVARTTWEDHEGGGWQTAGRGSAAGQEEQEDDGGAMGEMKEPAPESESDQDDVEEDEAAAAEARREAEEEGRRMAEARRMARARAEELAREPRVEARPEQDDDVDDDDDLPEAATEIVVDVRVEEEDDDDDQPQAPLGRHTRRRARRRARQAAEDDDSESSSSDEDDDMLARLAQTQSAARQAASRVVQPKQSTQRRTTEEVRTSALVHAIASVKHKSKAQEQRDVARERTLAAMRAASHASPAAEKRAAATGAAKAAHRDAAEYADRVAADELSVEDVAALRERERKASAPAGDPAADMQASRPAPETVDAPPVPAEAQPAIDAAVEEARRAAAKLAKESSGAAVVDESAAEPEPEPEEPAQPVPTPEDNSVKGLCRRAGAYASVHEFAKAAALFERALEGAGRGKARFTILGALGKALVDGGQLDAAVPHLQAAVDMAAAAGEARSHFAALRALSECHGRRGDAEAAAAALEAARGLAESQSQSQSRAAAAVPPPPPSPMAAALENAVHGDFDPLRRVLQGGEADVNYAHPATGATALMVAAGRGQVDIVRALLARGAAPGALDVNGWSAERWAEKWGRRAVLDVLRGPKPSRGGGGGGSKKGGRRARATPSQTSEAARRGELVGRELQAWDGSGGPDETLESEQPQEGGNVWNQFAANEKLFGVKAQFKEEAYTTALDSASVTPAQRAAAERAAAEIQGTASANVHVAEERGQEIDPSISEEARYGSVARRGKKKKAKGKKRHADSFTDAGVNLSSS